MHIIVHQAVRQKQLALKSVGEKLIRLAIVIRRLAGYCARLFNQRCL